MTTAYPRYHELRLYQLECLRGGRSCIGGGKEVNESCTFTLVDSRPSTATSDKRKIAKEAFEDIAAALLALKTQKRQQKVMSSHLGSISNRSVGMKGDEKSLQNADILRLQLTLALSEIERAGHCNRIWVTP